jgi:hypothetical protein
MVSSSNSVNAGFLILGSTLVVGCSIAIPMIA